MRSTTNTYQNSHYSIGEANQLIDQSRIAKGRPNPLQLAALAASLRREADLAVNRRIWIGREGRDVDGRKFLRNRAAAALRKARRLEESLWM